MAIGACIALVLAIGARYDEIIIAVRRMAGNYDSAKYRRESTIAHMHGAHISVISTTILGIMRI